MTQEDFMVNMIDKGWVKIKAAELRKYIRRKESLEVENDILKSRIDKLEIKIENLRDRLDSIKAQQVISVDLEV